MPTRDPSSPTDAGVDPRRVDELQSALGEDFVVEKRLGEGSAATVYQARERALGRPVAVKVLRPGKAGEREARLRFEREARAAASLSHPNVVDVYRFGELADGTPYLVMRFVKGRTLEDRIAAEGRLSGAQAIQVLVELASALAAAHARGIVHRDVRPANVLWDDEQHKALLSDFGIAALTAPSGPDAVRLTRTGQMLGTPKYMSPEQLLDQEITESADVYALGVLGYEILTGDGPYAATTNAQWITAHLNGTPKDLRAMRPDVDPRVADLLRRCLNREPRHRPTAADLARALGSPGDASDADPLTGDLQQLLKRRVPQIVLLAGGVGLGTMGLVDQLVENELLPDIAYRLTLVTALCAVAVAGVVGWFHGERGRQKSPTVERVLLAIIALVWIGLLAFTFASGG